MIPRKIKMRFIILSILICLKTSILAEDLFMIANINLPKCNKENKIINANICQCKIISENYLATYHFKSINDTLVREGHYFLYNLDSVLLLKAEYHLDTLLNITIYDDSKLETYEIFQGLLNGKYYSYWLNGKIRSTGTYKNNQRSGRWNFYHNNGIIESSGEYYPNLRIIEVDSCLKYIYLKNNLNEIVEKLDFSKNKMELLLDKYNLNKSSFFVYPYIVNFKDKIWEYFDINGQIIRKENWNNGVLIKP